MSAIAPLKRSSFSSTWGCSAEPPILPSTYSEPWSGTLVISQVFTSGAGNSIRANSAFWLEPEQVTGEGDLKSKKLGKIINLISVLMYFFLLTE